MALYGTLFVLLILFVLNMGGSNFGASFAAAYGGKILTKKKAQFLFIIFVILGAAFVGRHVSETLGNRIIPHHLITPGTLVIILFSATLSLFISNLLKVPQSTSFVAVASILGVGLYHGGVYTEIFRRFIPFWVILPVAGYVATYLLGKIVYPPRRSNFWIYEKLINQKDRLKVFVIIASCYNAFSVGTNNVANAVGPLAGAGILNITWGLIILGPVFGLGSLLFHGTLDTTSEKIVPLGPFSATIICIVTGTLVIIASIFGVPQSFVMIKVAAIFAISSLKKGSRTTFSDPLTRRTYMTWAITPMVALAISYSLTWVRYAVFK